MASHKEGSAARAFIRGATQLLLVADNQCGLSKDIRDVFDAILPLFRDSQDELALLWERPRPALTLVKLLATYLCRADTALNSDYRSGLAQARLVDRVLSTLTTALTLLSPRSAAPGTRAQLISAVLAVLRSGTLHRCARLFSRFAAHWRSARAVSPMDPSAPIDTAHPDPHPGREPAGQPSVEGFRAHVVPHVEGVLGAVNGIMSYALALEQQGDGHGSGLLMQEVLAALAGSKLLDHAAQALFAAGNATPVTNRRLLDCVLLMGEDFGDREKAHALGLPGPCMLHLLTIQAVECLRAAHGGGDAGPECDRFGLPAEAVAAAQRLLGCSSGDEPPGTGRMDPRVAQLVLYPWTVAMMAGAGLPRQCFMDAAAIERLCCVVFDASITCAEAEVERRQGGDISSTSAQGRQQDDGAAGIAAVDDGDPHMSMWLLSTSVGALLIRSDAVPWRRSQQKQPPPQQHLGKADGMATLAEAPEEGDEDEAETPQPAARAPACEVCRRPPDWWTASVRTLGGVLAADLARDLLVWPDVATLLRCQLGHWGTLPGLLPSAPPADLSSALAAGILPALERLLRRKHSDLFGTTAWRDMLLSLLGWRRLGWLLAYGEPRQAAALVAALGKVLWHAVAATTPCVGGSPSQQAHAAARQPLAAEALRAAAGVLLDGLNWARAAEEATAVAAATNASVEINGFEGGGGGGGSAGSQPDGFWGRRGGIQLRRLLAYALARWLPVVCRWAPAVHLQWHAGAIADAQRSAAVRDVLRLLAAALDWADDDAARCQAAEAEALESVAASADAGERHRTVPFPFPLGPTRRQERGHGPGRRQAGRRAGGAEPRAGSDPQCRAAASRAAWRVLLLEHVDAPRVCDDVAGGVAAGLLEPRDVCLLPSLLHRLLVGHVEEIGYLCCQQQMRRWRQRQQQGASLPCPCCGSGGGSSAGERGGVGGASQAGGAVCLEPCLRLVEPGGALPDASLAALLRSVLCWPKGDAGSGQGPMPQGRGPPSAPEVPPAPSLPPLPPLLQARSLLRACANPWCTNLGRDSEAELALRASEASGGRRVCRVCEDDYRREGKTGGSEAEAAVYRAHGEEPRAAAEGAERARTATRPPTQAAAAAAASPSPPAALSAASSAQPRPAAAAGGGRPAAPAAAAAAVAPITAEEIVALLSSQPNGTMPFKLFTEHFSKRMPTPELRAAWKELSMALCKSVQGEKPGERYLALKAEADKAADKDSAEKGSKKKR